MVFGAQEEEAERKKERKSEEPRKGKGSEWKEKIKR